MTSIFQVYCCLPKIFRQFFNSNYNFSHLPCTCYLFRNAQYIIYSTNLIYNLCRVSQLVIAMESLLLINNSGIESFLASMNTILVSRYSYYHVIQVQFLSGYLGIFSFLCWYPVIGFCTLQSTYQNIISWVLRYVVILYLLMNKLYRS